MIKLRDYQLEAVEAVKQDLNKHKKVLVISPTASGKSFMIADICKRMVAVGKKALVLCYQGEILAQNEKALNTLAPEVTTGIYCAGQGRKDTDKQVIFASRQSLARNPLACGKPEIIIVDEAHMISPNAGTQYQRIFKETQCSKIIGFTGTPWRLNGGKIWGPKATFNNVSFNIELDFLIQRGFLSRYELANPIQLIDTEDVSIIGSNKDFNIVELEKVSSTKEVISDCIDQWEMYKNVRNRKVSIFFCCSVVHSLAVLKELKRRGHKAAQIDGHMKPKEREQFMKDAKDGKYSALVNVGVLTTGVDIPIIDCVVMLRATMSASLFVQSCGRGLRTHPGKDLCLILDFTDNFDRFGDLNKPRSKDKELEEVKEVKQPPGNLDLKYKKCPQCKTMHHIATKQCDYCLHIFITHTSHIKSSSVDSINGWFDVESVHLRRGLTRANEFCFIASYKMIRCKKKRIQEWLLTTRSGYVGEASRRRLNEVKELKPDGILKIFVDDITKDFPRVEKILPKAGAKANSKAGKGIGTY